MDLLIIAKKINSLNVIKSNKKLNTKQVNLSGKTQ